MKHLLLIMITFPAFCLAQTKPIAEIFPTKDGNIYYEQIVSVDSANQETLLKRARQWVLSNQPSKDANFAEDKEAGIVSANGMFSHLMSAPPVRGKDTIKMEGQFWYVVKVMAKDGKAKVTIDNVRYQGLRIEDLKTQYQSIYSSFNKKYMERFYNSLDRDLASVNRRLEKLVNSISSYLAKPEDNF